MSLVDVYCITWDDETDVLSNAVESCWEFSSRIWLFDGGPQGHLCHSPRPDPMSVEEFAVLRGCEYVYHEWPGNPGAQRNFALQYLAEHSTADWIAMVDSDEMYSHQLAYCIRETLPEVSEEIAQITPFWLTLYPDEFHCTTRDTAPLAHSRLLRRGVGRFGETWHEHLFVEGERLYWPACVIHLRQLFPNRLKRQRGQDITTWWDSFAIAPLPPGVTWRQIIYPEEDRP